MSVALRLGERPARIWSRPANPPSAVISIGIAVSAVAAAQIYARIVGLLSIDGSYVAFVAFQLVLLALMVLGAQLEHRPLRDLGFFAPESLGVTVLFAALLVMSYVALRLDPGFIFGFGKEPAPLVGGFGYLLLTTPLAAVAELGLFFGYLGRTLSRSVSLRTSVLVSAGFYATFSTNFALFGLLDPNAAVEYLFSTTLATFVLGIVLALYFYKSRWCLLGPLVFLAASEIALSVAPVGVNFPSWEVAFASGLVAVAVLLILVGVGLREPRLQALFYLGERIGPKRYRFRSRLRESQETKSLIYTAAVVGVVAITIVYGLPQVMGTSHPFLAIATGSMVPTLERGTLVVVEHVAPTAITVGTIIAFDVSCLPAPTVHRVVRIVSEGPSWVFQTKGDANHAQDPCTVPYSAVQGAVVAIVPYAGLLILDPLFAASVVILLLVIPLLWRGPRL